MPERHEMVCAPLEKLPCSFVLFSLQYKSLAAYLGVFYVGLSGFI
jgi:hypothetical protein